MDEYKLDVLVLPTAGWNNKNRMPTENGLRRIEKAVRLANLGETEAVLILGGRRNNGPSEAELYWEYANRNYRISTPPNKTFWLWHAAATDTQKDIVAGEEPIGDVLKQLGFDTSRTCRIGIVSYPSHAQRAAMALDQTHREIIIINSGERPMYPPLIEKALTWLTNRDPRWEHLPAIVFAWIAYQRFYQTFTNPYHPK